MANLVFTLTSAGARAATTASGRGAKIELTKLGIGTGNYTPAANRTALEDEKQTVLIQAGNINENNNVLDYAVIFPPDTTVGSFTIREIGVYGRDPDTAAASPDILFFVYSDADATKSVSYKSENEEFYFSVTQQIVGVDASSLTVNSPNPDFALLLGTEFRKYIRKTDVTSSLDLNTESKVLSAKAGKIINERLYDGVVPPGCIIAVPVKMNPAGGYLKCDGAAVSRTTFYRLFAVISTYFGSLNNTTFNIPDYRGEFLRGFDDGRGVDTNRRIGIWQSQQIQSHTHEYYKMIADDSVDGVDSTTTSFFGKKDIKWNYTLKNKGLATN